MTPLILMATDWFRGPENPIEVLLRDQMEAQRGTSSRFDNRSTLTLNPADAATLCRHPRLIEHWTRVGWKPADDGPPEISLEKLGCVFLAYNLGKLEVRDDAPPGGVWFGYRKD